MNKVLVDTDAIFALHNPTDLNHARALESFKGLVNNNSELIITSFVLYEIATLTSYRISQEKSLEIIDNLLSSHFVIIYTDKEIENKAFNLFRTITKNKTSFVDCINQIVLEDFNIPNIFSFDKFYGDKLIA